MATIEGVFVCGKFEKVDLFQWTDPTTNQVKPIRSVKMLLSHGDGTVSRESLSIPTDMNLPMLREGEIYAFPCTVTINKKRQTVSWTLVPDRPPFLAPDMD